MKIIQYIKTDKVEGLKGWRLVLFSFIHFAFRLDRLLGTTHLTFSFGLRQFEIGLVLRNMGNAPIEVKQTEEFYFDPEMKN